MADGLASSVPAATRWRAERMDYDLGVWVLCNRAKRAREHVAAETPADTW